MAFKSKARSRKYMRDYMRRRRAKGIKPNYRTQRKYHLMSWYGITPEAYDVLLQSQNCTCAICGKPAGDSYKGVLHVDHDHETGRIRGLLCGACNTALGKFEDDPVRLQKAIEYLG